MSILNNISLLLENLKTNNTNRYLKTNSTNDYILYHLPKILPYWPSEILIELYLYDGGASKLDLWGVVYDPIDFSHIEMIGLIPRNIENDYWDEKISKEKLGDLVYSYLKINLKNIPTDMPCSFRIANTALR